MMALGVSEFDTQALEQRADQWRVEAARASSEDMRMFCIREAEACERRLRQSFDTPVIRVRGQDSARA
jgi:hypothetical protein